MLNIKLDSTIILPIPFLWYREEQIYCPVDFVKEVGVEEFINIINFLSESVEINMLDEIRTFDKFNLVIQRNVLTDSNIYICCHSFAYHEDFIKNCDFSGDDSIVSIPSSLNKNYIFNIKCVPVNIKLDSDYYNTNILSTDICQGEYISGSVFIHDSAFSPPGIFKFKVDESMKINVLLSFVKSDNTNFDKCVSLFFIIDGLGDGNDIYEKLVSCICEIVK